MSKQICPLTDQESVELIGSLVPEGEDFTDFPTPSIFSVNLWEETFAHPRY